MKTTIQQILDRATNMKNLCTEMFVQAFIQEMGCKPSEIVLVQYTDYKSGKIEFYFEKKEKIMDSEAIEKHTEEVLKKYGCAITAESMLAEARRKAQEKERAVSFFRVLARTKNGVKVRNGIYFMRKAYFCEEDHITAQRHAKLTGDIVVMIDHDQWINL